VEHVGAAGSSAPTGHCAGRRGTAAADLRHHLQECDRRRGDLTPLLHQFDKGFRARRTKSFEPCGFDLILDDTCTSWRIGAIVLQSLHKDTMPVGRDRSRRNRPSRRTAAALARSGRRQLVVTAVCCSVGSKSPIGATTPSPVATSSPLAFAALFLPDAPCGCGLLSTPCLDDLRPCLPARRSRARRRDTPQSLRAWTSFPT
jgi:hypothetical protein